MKEKQAMAARRTVPCYAELLCRNQEHKATTQHEQGSPGRLGSHHPGLIGGGQENKHPCDERRSWWEGMCILSFSSNWDCE